jgi:hypothetical protein
MKRAGIDKVNISFIIVIFMRKPSVGGKPPILQIEMKNRRSFLW